MVIFVWCNTKILTQMLHQDFNLAPIKPKGTLSSHQVGVRSKMVSSFLAEMSRNIFQLFLKNLSF